MSPCSQAMRKPLAKQVTGSTTSVPVPLSGWVEKSDCWKPRPASGVAPATVSNPVVAL